MVNPQKSWDQYQTLENYNKSKETVEEKTIDPPDIQQQRNKSWDNYLTPESYSKKQKEGEESWLEFFGRNALSGLARAGEQVIGRYGNIEKASKDVLSNFPFAGGLLGYGLQKLMGQDKWDQMVYGKDKSQTMLPTSEDIKKGITDPLTGEYLKPKGKGEEAFQEFSEDVGAALSFRRLTPSRRNLINNLGIPAAANIVKNTVDWLGFGKDKAQIAKIASWIPLSLVANVNARQFATDLVRRGREGLPNYLSTDVPRYQRRLAQATANMPRNDPATAAAWEAVRGIEDDLERGLLSPQSLATRYDAINRLKNSRSLFELSTGQRRLASQNIDNVRHVVRDELRDVAQNHPEQLNQIENGMQALAVINQSNRMTNAISRWLTGPYSKLAQSAVGTLFGISPTTALFAPSAGAVGTAATLGAAGAYKTGQVAYRVYQNPNLARYYWNAVSAAQMENAPAFINNYEKLSKEYEKKYQKKLSE